MLARSTKDPGTSEAIWRRLGLRLGTEYEERRTSDHEQLEQMMRYAQSAQCRTRYIQKYFGEEASADCGHCDNCSAGTQTVPRANRRHSAAKATREQPRLERLIASAVGNVKPTARET